MLLLSSLRFTCQFLLFTVMALEIRGFPDLSQAATYHPTLRHFYSPDAMLRPPMFLDRSSFASITHLISREHFDNYRAPLFRTHLLCYLVIFSSSVSLFYFPPLQFRLRRLVVSGFKISGEKQNDENSPSFLSSFHLLHTFHIQPSYAAA